MDQAFSPLATASPVPILALNTANSACWGTFQGRYQDVSHLHARQKGNVCPVKATHIMEGRLPWEHESMVCSFWEGIMNEDALLAHNHLRILGAVPAQAGRDAWG